MTTGRVGVTAVTPTPYANDERRLVPPDAKRDTT